MENLDFEYVLVDSYPLNSEETIAVEKTSTSFILCSEGEEVDLNTSYTIEGLNIVQKDVKITLENDEQLSYFITLTKEVTHVYTSSRDFET